MKISILALLYLVAPALMVPQQTSVTRHKPSAMTVVYKSVETPAFGGSDEVPYVLDDENCDEELVDFEPSNGEGLLRYTMLRAD